jgi:hypothetical protein
MLEAAAALALVALAVLLLACARFVVVAAPRPPSEALALDAEVSGGHPQPERVDGVDEPLTEWSQDPMDAYYEE